VKAFHSKDLAQFAVAAAGYLPSQDVQRDLAGVVLDPGQPEGLRSAASVELVRSLQAFGRHLTAGQVKNLEAVYLGLPESKLKGNVATVLGSLRPDAVLTGERLQLYVPTFAAPAAAEPAPTPAAKDAEEK
jgi:hypothetical protein